MTGSQAGDRQPPGRCSQETREPEAAAERRDAEEELRGLLIREQAARAEAEAAGAMFRGLLESAPDGIVIVDPAGGIVLVNTQVEQMFGYRRDELLGEPVEMLLPERYRAAHSGHRGQYHAAPRTRPMGVGLDLFARRKDGDEFPVEISLSPLETPQGVLVTSIIRDVTDRKLAEQERLLLLAREKERSEQLKLAIQEAHHRIKNNLQAVSDLLYLELSSHDVSESNEALRASIERIQAIALVHDLLSQEQDVQTVDAHRVIDRLVPMVLRSGGLSPEAVSLQLQLTPVTLPSKTGTALALILNELVSNAVKHAFAPRRGGQLQVSFKGLENGLQLCVADDGPGLPAGFDAAVQANVGLQVVQTLAVRDLDGTLSLENDNGLKASIWFPYEADRQVRQT